jgi:uncharacterized protein (DUF885 family)
MPDAFGRLPKADVEIKAYPAYRATGPGVYFIAVTDPIHRSRAIQQSVLQHKTYPRHHLQGAIALELGERVHPSARYLWNSGFGGGWAL